MCAEQSSNCSRFIVGVDEAGRGPVIGDMLIALVAQPEDRLELLKKIGVKDSKKLDQDSRKVVYEGIASGESVVVVVYIPPWILDDHNINDVEGLYIEKGLWILSSILRKARVCHVRVEVDEVKGRSKVIEKSVLRHLGFAETVDVIVEPKADTRYLAVSAASIVAKVSRDNSLKPLKRLVGDFGSGYASDPKTREWIESRCKFYSHPPVFIRRSWSTLKNIAPCWYREKKRRGQVFRTLLDYVKR